MYKKVFRKFSRPSSEKEELLKNLQH